MAVVTKELLGLVVLPGSATDTYVLTASSLTGNLQQSNVRILCDTSTGVVNLTLPEISTFNNLYQGLVILIVDSGNNAGSNTISISPGGSDTLEGDASAEIGKNSKSMCLRVADRLLWDRTETA